MKDYEGEFEHEPAEMTPLARCEAARQRLLAAIRKHRDQRGDDRCWLDDIELYNHLGDGGISNNALPCKELFLANCARYYDNRCRNAGWPSYQALQVQLRIAMDLFKRLQELDHHVTKSEIQLMVVTIESLLCSPQ